MIFQAIWVAMKDACELPDQKDSTRPSTAVVDLFCGAGGLAYGMKSAGLNVVAGVDLDPACRHPIEQNTGAQFACRDVSAITGADLDSWFGNAGVRVLAGCAPCQPFSTYSQSRKTVDIRWNLLSEFRRLAVEVLPEIVTMENVPGLADQAVWREFVEALKGAGYFVSWRKVACEDFGIPQKRRRLVLLASRLGEIDLLKPSNTAHVTVRDAIGQLGALAAGETSASDALHTAASLSTTNLERIRASRAGGTWRDWPTALRAACHVRASGHTYPSVYGRMEWGRPSPTMTTQCYGFGNGRFGHPDQDRAISLREAAILQSFPIDYKFLAEGEKVTFTRLGTLIGNAVPPKLAEAIGLTILAHLDSVHAGDVQSPEQLEMF